MTSRTRNRILAAVAAAVPALALALPAPAQTRVNQDGRARDANPRVGSDGSNDANNALDARGAYTGNQVVTGNVSGARAFRGAVPYRDPLEFSGPTAGRQSDRFVRDSAGAPTRSNPAVDWGRPTAFYGDSRVTPPPPGFRPEGFTGGLFNTGADQRTMAARSPYQNGQSWSAFDNLTDPLLRPSEFVMSNGVNQETNQPQFLSASPLYGVLPTGNQPGVLGPESGAFDFRSPADRFRLDPAERDRMRDELNEAGRADEDTGGPVAQPLEPAVLEAQPLSGEVGSSNERTLSPRAAAAVGRNQANVDVSHATQLQNRIAPDRLQGGVRTQQGVQSPLNVPPSRQSKQYAELQARFEARRAQGAISPEEANQQERLLRRQLQADAGAEKARPGVGQPGARPQQPGANPRQQPGAGQDPGAGPARPPLPISRRGGAAQPPPADAAAPQPEEPQQPAAQPAPGAQRPEPLRIKSLAEGVEAKGLRDLLAGAEELMKAGNFRSAIEKYTDAEQVAPNNPLIRLGRAQAELGATRYVSAEQHLREAFAADPALLMGRYDLESFIGRERLGFLVKELQQISRTEASSPRPMILLAYIAYGTGQDAAAADYLNQAAERSRRPDPMIQAMRENWSLPAGGATAPAQRATPPAEAPEAAQPETTTEPPAPEQGGEASDLNK